MSAITSIETKLKKALQPSHLEVIDESYLHNVEPGRESHVRIVAISNLFEGLNLVKRHQLIYAEIQDEIAGPIHALSLHTFTDDEWLEKNKKAEPSPDCLGGSKNDS
ncbi:MAG: BolA/IbaG family iron-sulfur metabolism protein [Gammaproteobacteria bacterium]